MLTLHIVALCQAYQLSNSWATFNLENVNLLSNPNVNPKNEVAYKKNRLCENITLFIRVGNPKLAEKLSKDPNKVINSLHLTKPPHKQLYAKYLYFLLQITVHIENVTLWNSDSDWEAITHLF